MFPEALTLVRRLAKALLGPFYGPVERLRAHVASTPGLALLVLAFLLVAAVQAVRGSRLAALAVVPLSFAWLLVNAPFEGPTLLTLSWSHGITTADLVSVVAVGIAGWRLTQPLVAQFR